jgi:hypothetical protein
MTGMKRLSDLDFQTFDAPDLPLLDHGRNDKTWAFILEGRREVMEPAVEAIRRFVNGHYPVPRALRFRSPHMLIVGVVDHVDDALEDWVMRHSTSTFLGGEVFHVLLVDTASRRVVVRVEGGKVGVMRHLIFRPDRFGARLLG